MNQELEETKNALREMVGYEEDAESQLLDLLVRGESRFIKDARMNLKKALTGEELDERQTVLIAYAVSVTLKNRSLQKVLSEQAVKADIPEGELAEAAACASLLSVNNVLYRFRHFCGKESYERMPAKIRMGIMARPVTGKSLFELMSLVVSAVNGCESCVKSHEASVLSEGLSEAQVFEGIRIGSVLKGIDTLMQ